jgi:hypothetical protein
MLEGFLLYKSKRKPSKPQIKTSRFIAFTLKIHFVIHQARPVNTPIIFLFSVFKSMFSFWLTQSNAFDSSNQHALLLLNVC